MIGDAAKDVANPSVYNNGLCRSAIDNMPPRGSSQWRARTEKSGSMTGHWATAERAGWVHAWVRVPLGPSPWDERTREGVRRLREIERWLAQNHRPLALFDRYGRPKSEVVSVLFPVSRPAVTLQFRQLCFALGLSETLKQGRVVPTGCDRTTPPR
jgi:hypothetical protein